MNNKYPQIHLIYNRYGNASPTKKAVAEIRVTHNYKHIAKQTKLSFSLRLNFRES